MGNFSREIRKLTIKPVGIHVVDIDSVKAQYNPYRFKHWQALHEGPNDKVLDIVYSPHVRLLAQYEQNEDLWKFIAKTAYYSMQQRYGRGHTWIVDKIKKFISIYEELRVNPQLTKEQSISVVETPIRENPYNDGYEVFEGHHRIACFCYMSISEIPVQVLRVIK